MHPCQKQKNPAQLFAQMNGEKNFSLEVKMENQVDIEKRILDLEKEIEQKKAELKCLKIRKQIDFSIYRTFRNGMYGGFGLSHCLNDAIRLLAVGVLTLHEKERTDGSKYLDNEPRAKLKDLDREHMLFCNEFANALYPTVEEYAEKILQK